MASKSNWTKEKEEAFKKAWAKLIAKAWNDSKLKERLLKNPKEVLKEQGIEFPEGVDCKITENTEKIVYLNLPKKPDGSLSESELRDIAGGYGKCGSVGATSRGMCG